MRSLPFHPALEGLRGLALFGVLLFHAELVGLSGGFLGVSTFFTLSGFLITGLLVSERERAGGIRLGAFWGRRLRRLMPAALAGLALIAALGTAFGDPSQRARLTGDGLASLFDVANWWLIASGADYADLMGSPSFVQHYWSLAIEEQYYAFFPLLAAGLLRGGRRRPLALALGVGTLVSWLWMIRLAGGDVPTARIYYGTDTRCAELLAGGLLALLWTDRPSPTGLRRLLPWLGAFGAVLTAVLWSVATVESPWLYRWGLPLHTLASLALILGCVAPTGAVRRGLASAPMRWLGRISYGAYVYHWPLFLVLDGERTGLDGAALLALRLALTLGLAALSHRWLEEPVRRGRRLPGRRAWWVGPPVFAGLAGVFLALGGAPLGSPAPGPPAAPARPRADAPRVAVVGDSLASNVAEGLRQWAERSGALVVGDYAIRGCAFARGAWPEAVDRRRRVCDRWPQLVERRMDAFEPDLVVALSGTWDLVERRAADWSEPLAPGDPAFDRWLIDQYVSTADFLSRLSSRGAAVVWLTTPCLRRPFGARNAAVYAPERVARMRLDILPAVRARSPHVVEVLDLYARVCPGGAFTNAYQGIEPFRPDGVHFSERAGAWVGGWLGPELVAVWERRRVSAQGGGLRRAPAG